MQNHSIEWPLLGAGVTILPVLLLSFPRCGYTRHAKRGKGRPPQFSEGIQLFCKAHSSLDIRSRRAEHRPEVRQRGYAFQAPSCMEAAALSGTSKLILGCSVRFKHR